MYVYIILFIFVYYYYFQITDASQISDIKKSISKVKPALYPDRQSLRLEVKGKSLKDSDKAKDLGK